MKDKKNNLKNAINKVTKELIDTIQHGQEIVLNEKYHLYKYCEEDIISIYKTRNDKEKVQVLTNGKDLTFEKL